MKRFVSLILCFLVIVVMGSGCFGTGKPGKAPSSSSSQSSTKENVVLYLPSFLKIPDSTAKVEKAINSYIDKTYPDAKVQLSIRLFSYMEYTNKLNLALGSGSSVDLFTPLGTVYMNIARNQCYPIEDLLKQYGKGIVNILARDFGADPFATFTVNGHIYGVPINKGFVLNTTLVWNEDILKKAGATIDGVKTIWDLEPVFQTIKEKLPGVYPFSALSAQDTGILRLMIGEKKIDSLCDIDKPFGVVFGSSNKVVNLYETKTFYDYIRLMRDWHIKGYMPPDLDSSTTSLYGSISPSSLFCTIGGFGGKPIGIAGNNIKSKWIAPFYMDSSSISFIGMCISNNSRNPENAMKIMDMLYTDKFVLNTILYGIEGEDYVKTDENHWAYPKGKDANTVDYSAALSTGVIGSEPLQYQMAGVPYENIQFKIDQNIHAERSPYYGFVFNPMPVINEMVALQKVFGLYMPGLVCGALDPDTTIPVYNSELKKAGIDKVIAEKQKQLDKWLASNKTNTKVTNN